MSRDYSGQTATLVPATLRGFRSWTVNPTINGMYQLTGQYGGHWSTKELVAECRMKKHLGDPEGLGWLIPSITDGVPAEHCTCGIYARYNPNSDGPFSRRGICGIIEASGTIVMGTKGFRAQRAKIVAFYGADWRRDTIQEIARQFNVHAYDSIDAALIDYPIEDLSAFGIRTEEFDLSYNTWSGVYDMIPVTNFSSCPCPMCSNQKFQPRPINKEEQLRLNLLNRAIASPDEYFKRAITTVIWTSSTNVTDDLEVIRGRQIIEEERAKLPRNSLCTTEFEISVKRAIEAFDYHQVMKRLLSLEYKLSFVAKDLLSGLGGA